MNQRSSTAGRTVREVQNQLTKVKLNHYNFEISNTRYIEKVFANVRKQLNCPEGDQMLEQRVNVLTDMVILFVNNDESIDTSWTKS